MFSLLTSSSSILDGIHETSIQQSVEVDDNNNVLLCTSLPILPETSITTNETTQRRVSSVDDTECGRRIANIVY